MPALNSVKTYIENGYYHVYNRGVEKRDIFLDEKDYTVFLRFLKEYLLPPKHPDLQELHDKTPRRHPINCHDKVKLLAFCLLPNHFHLFLKQSDKTGLQIFMKALATNYVMYFNYKYQRVGSLFQGVYKAALVDSDPYYLHITRYIHRNARVSPLQDYPYSSYQYYLSQQAPDWLDIQEILSFFHSGKSVLPKDVLSYQSFVEYEKIDDSAVLGGLRLED